MTDLPWNDWQFWVVTATAAGGLLQLLRPFFRQAGRPGDGCPGCDGCHTRPTPSQALPSKLVVLDSSSQARRS